MVGDTVNIDGDKAIILTKHAKSPTDVTYIISKENSDDGSDSSDEEDDRKSRDKSRNDDPDAIMARDHSEAKLSLVSVPRNSM